MLETVVSVGSVVVVGSVGLDVRGVSRFQLYVATIVR